ncbi:hypothetical protein GQ53DRAFT_297948 [Thozetella sp. PMI_491]|nr:hypothetical protein GQ53DRAFT_297948 [Thozetella sp. PMI_491]
MAAKSPLAPSGTEADTESSPLPPDPAVPRTVHEISTLSLEHSSHGLDGPEGRLSLAGARQPSHLANADDLPMSIQDAIFQHQMSQIHPLSITPQTLIAAGICGWENEATNVHQALVKAGVLEPSSAPQKHTRDHGHSFFGLGKSGKQTSDYAEEEFLPVTANINGALTKKVRVLTVVGAKTLIKLLFFWEEEVNRWRARESDVVELEAALARYVEERQSLEDGGVAAMGRAEEEIKEEKDRLERMANEVRFRIQAVRLRRRVKPSERQVEVALPQYET